MKSTQLKDGFTGQRMVYVPGKTKKMILEDDRINDLYITHIGHFPKAKGHYRERPLGCSQSIFIYCRSGKGWIILNKTKYSIKANQAFIIPPNTPCSYGADETQPWNNYWIHFEGKNASNYAPEYSKIIHISKSIHARIEDRMMLFEEMLQNMEQFSNFENVVYANITLKYFFTTLKQIENFRITEGQLTLNSYQRALTYMRNHLKKRISLKELSEISECSESNLHKLFVKNLRCSPLEYFLQMKLQRACRYLTHSSRKVKDIAQELGYDDPYYFSRLFSKYIGKSPQQYRNEEHGHAY